MDADEAGVGPALGERGQRDPDQVRAVGGVQPGVVALRLDPAHRRARQHPGGAGQLDRDGRVVLALAARRAGGCCGTSARRAPGAATRRAGRPARACGRSRSRPGRTPRRRGRRTRSRTRSPAAGRTGRAPGPAPCRPGRACGCRGRPRRRRRRAAPAAPRWRRRRCGRGPPGGRRAAGRPARRAPAARRRRPAPAGSRSSGLTLHRARTASRTVRRRMELRDPHADLRARAGRGLHHQPERVPEHRPQPFVHIGQPDVLAGVGRRSSPSRPCSTAGSMPTPSSSTVMWHSAPASRASMLTVPTPGLRDRPCRTAFSTSGCRHRNGRPTGSTSGAICSRTCSRSPNRARSMVRYRSIERSSSASVVNSPCARNEYRVNSANSRISSRARSGSVRTNEAIAVSAL